MSEWQPIETVQEDEEVLLLDSDGNIRIGVCIFGFDGNKLFRSDLDFGDFYATAYFPDCLTATHWQPLPVPPSGEVE